MVVGSRLKVVLSMIINSSNNNNNKNRVCWASIPNPTTPHNPVLVALISPATTTLLTTLIATLCMKTLYKTRNIIKRLWASIARITPHHTITMKMMKPWSRVRSRPLNPHLIGRLRSIRLIIRGMGRGRCRNIRRVRLMWLCLSQWGMIPLNRVD